MSIKWLTALLILISSPIFAATNNCGFHIGADSSWDNSYAPYTITFYLQTNKGQFTKTFTDKKNLNGFSAEHLPCGDSLGKEKFIIEWSAKGYGPYYFIPSPLPPGTNFYIPVPMWPTSKSSGIGWGTSCPSGFSCINS